MLDDFYSFAYVGNFTAKAERCASVHFRMKKTSQLYVNNNPACLIEVYSQITHSWGRRLYLLQWDFPNSIRQVFGYGIKFAEVFTNIRCKAAIAVINVFQASHEINDLIGKQGSSSSLTPLKVSSSPLSFRERYILYLAAVLWLWIDFFLEVARAEGTW